MPTTMRSRKLPQEPMPTMAAATMKCPSDKERVGFECCTQCGIGYGMISKCYRDKDGEFHDTACQRCSHRNIMTFSSTVSAVSNCEKCRPCNRPIEVLESECTITKDTVCKCAPGYYRRRMGPAECVPCAVCPPGEGLAPVCTGTRAGDCLPCPPGQFSAYSRNHGNRLCQPCPTGCPSGYRLLPGSCAPASSGGGVCSSIETGRLFNATDLIESSQASSLGKSDGPRFPQLKQSQQDQGRHRQQQQKDANRRLAVSDWKELIDNGNANGDIANSKAYNPVWVNVTQATRTEEPVSRLSSSSNDMIPVYCAVLGTLIVSLVLWIVFKYFRRRVQDRKVQQQQQFANALIPPQSPVYPPPRICQPTALVKRKSVDSGFGGSDAFAASINSNTRLLKEISDSRFQRLENILSNNPNPNGWKELAGELGFQAAEVQEFEVQADVVRQSPIRLMLKSWSEKSGSTIGAFSRCLQKVNRKDVLILFKESERHHHHQHHHQGRHKGLQPQPRQVPEEVGSLQEMCQV